MIIIIKAVISRRERLSVWRRAVCSVSVSATAIQERFSHQQRALFIFAVLVVLSFVGIAVSALINSIASRSTFYSIAAVAGAGMLLFQTALNIFGITDVLPLTGVTLPFVSQGGSSMICCWAVLAYIKASDVRTYNYLGGAKKKGK